MRFKILIVLLCLSLHSYSQDEEVEVYTSSAPNIYLELFGNGLFLSLNYDQRFNKTGKGLGFRAGLGMIPGFGFGIGGISTMLTVPIGLNYLVGNGPHHFEMGAGATFLTGKVNIFAEEEDASGFVFIPSAAYRFQQMDRGFTGRLSITPLLGEGGASFYFGLSAGIRLK